MARTVSVKLRLEVGGYVAGAKQAEQATTRIGDGLDKTAKRGKVDLDRVATGLGIVGAGLLGIAAAAVTAAASFDKQMSEVGAVSNATAEQLKDLRQAAIDAGQATVFSASEAAQAEAELAKAGVSTADILGGALSGSLSLASAGSLDLATSATIAASAMNTFGLGGDQVEHIADVLAAAANKSAAGVDDLGQGLQQVGLVANQVGLTFEETVALLGAFADRGLKGSDGATSLKTALQRLAAPTEQAAATMKELGLSFYNSNGQMKDIVEVSGDLQTALKDLSPAQRNAALNTIFGSDAIRAANVLYSEGSEGIQSYVDAVNDQGAASRVAAQKMDNLSGDVEQLKGSLETLFISSGEGANGGLRLLAKAITEIVNGFSSLPGPVQSTVIVVAGLTGGILLLAAAGIKVQSSIARINESLIATGPAGARAAAGLSAVTRIGAKATGVLALLTIGSQILHDSLHNDISPDLDEVTKGLRDWNGQTALAGSAALTFGANAEKLDDALKTVANTSGANGGWSKTLDQIDRVSTGLIGLNGVYEDADARVKAFDDALAGLVKAGDAAVALNILTSAADHSGVSVDKIKQSLPQYTAALGDAATATKKAATDTVELNRAQVAAVQSGEKLVDLWDEFHGAVASADQTMLAAKQSINDIKDAFDQNGASIAGNTEAALENRIALEDAARKAELAADAYLQAGGSVDGAKKILHDFEDQAITATGATGKQKDAVKALADSLFALPQNTTANVNLNIYGEAAVSQGLDLLDRARSQRRRWGGITTHAATGALRDAAVFSTQSPARYAFAEPATGGEAFVPRLGNPQRSMSILHAAAGWYNADVVPKQGWYGGSSGGQVAGTVDVHVRVEDPRGKVLTDTISSYAVNTGRAPIDLWSAKRR